MITKNIVFIDSRVSNYQSHIDSLTQPSEIFMIDGDSDGLQQIATSLQGRVGIDAIHVISHGSQGTLYLGNTVLNSGNLAHYQSQLASIGNLNSTLPSTFPVIGDPRLNEINGLRWFLC